VSSKEGTFSKEGGHKSQEKISVSFGPNYFSAVGGRTVRIRTVCTDSPYNAIWHEIEAFWAQFSRQFQNFVRCFWAIWNSPYS
jgi:hypothetical protein